VVVKVLSPELMVVKVLRVLSPELTVDKPPSVAAPTSTVGVNWATPIYGRPSGMVAGPAPKSRGNLV